MSFTGRQFLTLAAVLFGTAAVLELSVFQIDAPFLGRQLRGLPRRLQGNRQDQNDGHQGAEPANRSSPTNGNRNQRSNTTDSGSQRAGPKVRPNSASATSAALPQTSASTAAPPVATTGPPGTSVTATTAAAAARGQAAAVAAAQQVAQIVNSAANRGSALGGLVRLAFHDAGTFNGIVGGADGCVDFTSPDNNGLQTVVSSLTPVVQAAAGLLSRADIWVLAANVAIQMAGGPSLVFEAGRVDSSSCAGLGNALPSAEGSVAEIQRVFVSGLNFTERETTALLGAHVLGRTTTANSGYNGQWVTQNSAFNNQYFLDMLNVPWAKIANPLFLGQSRTQWNRGNGNMMLNTDATLAFDITTGCTRFGGGGGGNSCPRSTTGYSSAVTEFAGSNAAFVAAFAPAFRKMNALCSCALSCVMPDCSTPAAR